MEPKAIHQEKWNRIQTTLDRKTPDRIPLLPSIETYVYQFAGISLKEAFTKDPRLAVDAFKKFQDYFDVDATLTNNNIIPLGVIDIFGEGIYTVNDKCLQIKGSHCVSMTPDEYPALIENAESFVTNVIVPRKYPKLAGDREEMKGLLGKAFEEMKKFGEYNAKINEGIVNEIGLPIANRSSCYCAPDTVLDYLRDFVGLSTDMRRHPQQLIDACHSIHEYNTQFVYNGYTTPETGNFVFTPLHSGTYMRPKDYEKFYFPFLKKLYQELGVEHGYTMYVFYENDYMPYLDILQDLPDGVRAIGLFEKGDFGTYKEKLGKKMTVSGGYPYELLKNGTVQQCIDKAKECIDEYAPGANYIFALDQVLMNIGDAQPENLKAVLDYVRENGKY